MRIIAERFANVHDALHQRIRRDRRIGPDVLHEFFFGDDPAAMLKQIEKDLK
jgi:hypothetical protein